MTLSARVLAVGDPAVAGREERLVAVLGAVAGGGRAAVVVRAPALGEADLLRLCRRIADAAGSAERLVVHRWPEAAARAGAWGVHLPERCLDSGGAAARAAGIRFGVSVHGLESARRAAEAGAAYLLFGPVYATPSKPGWVQGLEALARVARAVEVPVLAVGGIRPGRAAPAVGAGAAGVAAVRWLLAAEDPAAAAAELADEVEGALCAAGRT